MKNLMMSMNVKSNLHSFWGCMFMYRCIFITFIDYKSLSNKKGVGVLRTRCSDDYQKNKTSNGLFYYSYFLPKSVLNYISLQNTLILTITQER